MSELELILSEFTEIEDGIKSFAAILNVAAEFYDLEHGKEQAANLRVVIRHLESFRIDMEKATTRLDEWITGNQ